MREKIVEWVKTSLIALLTVSALMLGWQTGLFSGFFRAIPVFGGVAELVRGAAASVATEPGGAPTKEAALPLIIVITNEEGERYGVKYDVPARNAVYVRTSSIFSEALGSASMPRRVNQDEWRTALSRPGVYFEYITPVKLSVLDGWLGTRLPDTMSDVSLRRVFIAFGEDRSRIYYQDSETGYYFRAETASSAGKAQELRIYNPNGAQFAFETGVSTAEDAPYVLIQPGSDYQEIRAASTGNAEELLDMVLYAMGHSNETYTTYYRDGAHVRVGVQFQIRADALGRVVYRRTDISPLSSEDRSPSDSEMIEKARVITADTLGIAGNGAEVFFETLEHGPGEAVSAFFGYYIAGGRIHLYEDGHAARVTFIEGIVSEIELVFRTFTLSGEFTRLLPERLALAAAGGEFILCYSDTGTERLQPAWILHN